MTCCVFSPLFFRQNPTRAPFGTADRMRIRQKPTDWGGKGLAEKGTLSSRQAVRLASWRGLWVGILRSAKRTAEARGGQKKPERV